MVDRLRLRQNELVDANDAFSVHAFRRVQALARAALSNPTATTETPEEEG